MAAAVTARTAIPLQDTTQATQIVRGSVALTGSYPGTAGDPLTFVKCKVQSSKPPIRVTFYESPSSSVAPSGYGLYYQPGTTPNNGAIRITSAAGTELTATTYPAALTGAAILFEAVFPLGV